MATNIVHEHGDQLYVTVTSPATPESGDPVVVGQLPGVALTDEQADGMTTVKFDGTATLMVEDEATGGIAVGDILYYDAGDAQLNNSASGNIRFGYALETVGDGATAEILVKIGY